MFDELTDLDDLKTLLDALQVSIIITDSRDRIVFANQAVCRLTGRSWNEAGEEISCAEFLFKNYDSCAGDSVVSEEDVENWEQSVTIPREDGESVYARKSLGVWQDYTIISLNDMTREVNLLRSLELSRKEQQAKNVLLERRRKETLSEKQLLRSTLDYLPEAVVSVRSSFDIVRRNKALSDIFPGKDARKCYELLGNEQPCQYCPAIEGFTGLNDVRKSHQVGESFITESITASPLGSGGLLVFRDTTRQIKLIEQIRQQRETILRKSRIMTSLADLGAMMQKEQDQSEVLEFFWDIFFDLVEIRKALLLVNDIRAGTIWYTSEKGFSEDEIREISKKYLSRDVQNRQQEALEIQLEDCHQTLPIFLKGKGSSLIGLLVLGGRFEGEEDMELIDIFTEPLGAYLENSLLSRKLEEKANTDPMTGLYNRGYFDQALHYEHKKFSTLGMNYAIVVADVNMLKKANDLYGHEAGDRLIRKVSKLLEDQVRNTDILARTGGDEFAILLPETDDHSAQCFVKRMEEEVFKAVFLALRDGEQFPIKVSFGQAGSDLFSNVEELLKEADRQMYEAKESYYQNMQKYR